jgi:hypothetical protein
MKTGQAHCARLRWRALAGDMGRRLGWCWASVLLALSVPALGDDWILLASDELNRTYLDADSLSRGTGDELRFRIRLAYNKRRDMMGLAYDTAIKDYVAICGDDLIVSKLHRLLNGPEVVWTFPVSSDRVRASAELPREVLLRVCP